MDIKCDLMVLNASKHVPSYETKCWNLGHVGQFAITMCTSQKN
jgi:hypothetical protein